MSNTCTRKGCNHKYCGEPKGYYDYDLKRWVNPEQEANR